MEEMRLDVDSETFQLLCDLFMKLEDDDNWGFHEDKITDKRRKLKKRKDQLFYDFYRAQGLEKLRRLLENANIIGEQDNYDIAWNANCFDNLDYLHPVEDLRQIAKRAGFEDFFERLLEDNLELVDFPEMILELADSEGGRK